MASGVDEGIHTDHHRRRDEARNLCNGQHVGSQFELSLFNEGVRATAQRRRARWLSKEDQRTAASIREEMDSRKGSSTVVVLTHSQLNMRLPGFPTA